jgi:hypothetical protein
MTFTMTLSINDILQQRHAANQHCYYAECIYLVSLAECRYAECPYAECCEAQLRASLNYSKMLHKGACLYLHGTML